MKPNHIRLSLKERPEGGIPLVEFIKCLHAWHKWLEAVDEKSNGGPGLLIRDVVSVSKRGGTISVEVEERPVLGFEVESNGLAENDPLRSLG